MYAYLINKLGYDHESLKAYKSFEGYRLFWDGHVLKLVKKKNLFNGYHHVKLGKANGTRDRDGGIYVERVLSDQEFWSPVLVSLIKILCLW